MRNRLWSTKPFCCFVIGTCQCAAKAEKRLVKNYTDCLNALELEEAASISGTRVGEQGDEYIVQHNGKKRELDRHFKKGNSRETRRCFRIYFFWDDEEEQVVVGWLTSHLNTRQT